MASAPHCSVLHFEVLNIVACTVVLVGSTENLNDKIYAIAVSIHAVYFTSDDLFRQQYTYTTVRSSSRTSTAMSFRICSFKVISAPRDSFITRFTSKVERLPNKLGYKLQLLDNDTLRGNIIIL